MASVNTNMSRAAPPTSLGQIAAMTLTFRRLLSIWGTAPMITVAFPFVSNAVYFVLNRITKNHAILTVLLTVLATVSFRNLIHTAAPTQKAAKESLEKSSTWLPLSMFLAASFLTRGAGPILGNAFRITPLLTWSPRISFSAAFRLAAGMALLGLAVAARYVGPNSVVRCSSSPLKSHPFTTALRSTWSKFTSVDAFLDLIAGPSETPGELLRTPLEDTTNARRLQRPRFASSFAQILLSTIIGAIVAYTSVLPFSPTGTHGDSSPKAALVMTCTLTVVLHLILTSLDGTSHELNPKRSIRVLGSRIIPVFLAGLGKSLFTATLVAPMFAITAAVLVTEQDWEELLNVVFACVVTALIVTSYMHGIDEAARSLLCTPYAKLKQLVDEVSDDDRSDACLDVVLYSILHADEALVKQLGMPLTRPRVLDLEVEEGKRNAESIKTMANTLLHGVENGSPLEEDILRVTLLESLGGTSSDGSSQGGLEGADTRHAHAVKMWVQPGDAVRGGGKRSEPLAVPLVRALCAYIGGLGEALVICSAQVSLTGNAWLLPPGAIACAEYAIRAACRCIIWNFSNSTRALADWRSTHLSMLVPVVLNSICRLEAGLVKYAQTRAGGKPSDHVDNKIDLIKTECPELLSVYRACNRSAAMILEKVQSLEGTRKVDLELDHECNKWTKELLSRHPSPAGKKYSDGVLMTFPSR